ncbi:MAG: single-stranded DNA-binding protein [Erysipelotrichales bacterium]|nr:single-stranded DNA-binding protein [Erysipelotrichales bacterium]
MSYKNKTELMGRLAADPAINIVKGNILVANIQIAIERTIFDENGTESKAVDFMPITLWRRKAEMIKDYKKGDLIMMDGHLELKSKTVSIDEKAKEIKVYEFICDYIYPVQAKNNAKKIEEQQSNENEPG